MNPLQLILLGLAVGAGAGLVLLLGAAAFMPMARARRVGLAGAIGAAIAFTLTALVQGPFYTGAKTLRELAEPMGLALLVAAAAAGLCALMILRAGRG
jgi:hypothetical protein